MKIDFNTMRNRALTPTGGEVNPIIHRCLFEMGVVPAAATQLATMGHQAFQLPIGMRSPLLSDSSAAKPARVTWNR